MANRRLNRMLREPFWLIVLTALIAGAIIGTIISREETSSAISLLGSGWRGTPKETRGALASVFGLQFTVLTIVLSLNAPLVQSAANQYSPRLVPFYLKYAPLRRAIPMFVLSTGYILAAERELGFHVENAIRPRPVVTGAFLLLFAAFSLLTVDMFRTFNFMRVERVLGLVRRSTLASARRVQSRIERLLVRRGEVLILSPGALALPASTSGYLVEVDALELTRRARQAGVRVRICREVGEYVDEGEVIGWYSAEAAEPIDPTLAKRLAAAVAIGAIREADNDPIYGIRILADVAARALSSSTNDPYTARQALQQIRSVLRNLARVPLGDWSVMDRDGTVRVSIMAGQLRELISLAVDTPLRHGASDLEVLDAVLEIALEVGLAAVDAEGRAAARELITRVLDDATQYGHLDGGRLKHLFAEAELVRTLLERDSPRAERHLRADWALMRQDATPAH